MHHLPCLYKKLVLTWMQTVTLYSTTETQYLASGPVFNAHFIAVSVCRDTVFYYLYSLNYICDSGI